MNRFSPMKSLVVAGAGFALTSLALLSAGTGGDPAQAQALANHNSNAPVDFAANSIEVQDRADRVVISGNVRVTQAGMTLTAARMTVAYSRQGGTDVNRLDATGGVVVTKGDERASGNVAIYDLDRRLITMVGNVELRQRGNNLRGGRMVIDLNSGRATVDGRGAARGPDGNPIAGGTGGRVTGTFTVPERKQYPALFTLLQPCAFTIGAGTRTIAVPGGRRVSKASPHALLPACSAAPPVVWPPYRTACGDHPGPDVRRTAPDRPDPAACGTAREILARPSLWPSSRRRPASLRCGSACR